MHVETWQAAYRGVVSDEGLDALDVAERTERWRGNLSAPVAARTIVAERDGEVVGFAGFGPDSDGGAEGELYAIYVHPSAWSTGAGRALMERVETELHADYDEAILWVLRDNPRARRFYERAGWTLDGGEKVLDWGAAAGLVEVRYRKRLR